MSKPIDKDHEAKVKIIMDLNEQYEELERKVRENPGVYLKSTEPIPN